MRTDQRAALSHAANLDELQARGGGGEGGRGELVARYNAECATAPAQPANIFDALVRRSSHGLATCRPSRLRRRPTRRRKKQSTAIPAKPRRVKGRLRALLRRQLLPGLLLGGRRPTRRSPGHVPRPVPQCRGQPLHLRALGRNRDRRFQSAARATSTSPNALKYRKSVEFDLLVPPTRAELGRRVGGRGVKAGRRRQERHHRDAGKIGGAVATQTGPQEQGRQDPGRRVARHNSGRQGGGPGPDPDGPARPAGGDRQPRSPPASRWVTRRPDRSTPGARDRPRKSSGRTASSGACE